MSSTMRFDTWQDSNGVLVASGAGGKFSAPGNVLQVVSTTKTDTFSMASATYANITGLAVTITPTSTSSKIFVTLTLGGVAGSNAFGAWLDVERNGSSVGVAATAGSRNRAGISISTDAQNVTFGPSWSFLDEPASTSALTYQARAAIEQTSAKTLYINRTNTDTDSANFSRAVSTITAWEIAG